MRFFLGLAFGAGAAIGVARIPDDWRSRAHVAWHVAQGKPTIYRASLVPPPLLRLARDSGDLLVQDVELDGRTGLMVG